MDKDLLNSFIALMNSQNDADAVMGLRGAQNLFKDNGVSMGNALLYSADNIAGLPTQPSSSSSSFINSGEVVSKDVSEVAPAPVAVPNTKGVPEFRIPRTGSVEVVLSGNSSGEVFALPGNSAADGLNIVENMKDAVVAAVINKCKFRIKLFDIKDNRGEVTATAVRAEYNREDMVPVLIWSNTRGEAGALASVLRNIISSQMPDLVA